MRVFIAILGLLSGYFVVTGTAVGASDEKWQQASEKNWIILDNQAAELYQFVVHGEWEQARQKVTNMGELLIATSFTGATGVEGVRALSDAIVQVKRALLASRNKEQYLMHATARLRLATDSLTHPQKAMWLQYEQMLRDDMNKLVQAERKQEWQVKANQWLAHIDRIRVAAIIQRHPRTIEKMESLVQLVQRGVQGEIQMELVNKGLHEFGDAVLRELFGKSKEKPTLGPMYKNTLPMRWTVMLAFIVCTILTYVALQKYRYEQEMIRPNRFRK